jgi:hypothetical protein
MFMPKSAGTKLPSIALAAGRPLANRGQPQSKLTKLEQQLSSLVEQVAELRKELKSSLASRDWAYSGPICGLSMLTWHS